MKTFSFIAIVVSAFAASLLSSCSGCCSGTTPAPGLRPAPVFAPLADSPVHYQK